MKEWAADPAMFKRSDVSTALKIYDEYVRKMSPTKATQPKFFEIDREQAVDPLLHTPIADRSLLTARSPIPMPAINQFVKADWRLTALGQIPSRRDNFTLSRLSLEEIDYYPVQGDMVFWQGYRYTIMRSEPSPESYWQQTGIWLGLLVECVIAPEGDARPVADLSRVAPVEINGGNPIIR